MNLTPLLKCVILAEMVLLVYQKASTKNVTDTVGKI